MRAYNVGEMAPSQMIWTCGPGALDDLPNFSALIMGLDFWNPNRCEPIDEARLLAIVRKIHGPQVERLRRAPLNLTDDSNAQFNLVGIPVEPFPRWFRCVRCGLLADYESNLFTFKPDRFRPEAAHFVHANCEKGNNSDAVPARFLMACRSGHLDDFPWHWFAHGGPTDCKGTLRFFEKEASLQTENLWVKCDTCSSSRSLVHAFGSEAEKNLPKCRGRHPHLDHYVECDEDPRTIVLGATNGWFPITKSVLAVPMEDNILSELVANGWEYFHDAESPTEVEFTVKTLKKTVVLPGIEKWNADEIWQVIQEKRNGIQPDYLSQEGIKSPEWKVFISDHTPKDWPHFMSREEDIPKNFQSFFSRILLLERLRVVNALIGFTRVEAPDETEELDERAPMAPLSKGRPEWLPASEVHGEGIFIRFDEKMMAEWEEQEPVKKRSEELKAGHQAWRVARKLEPDKGYPGIRYVMLHSFAHLLIRELALECGYNAASIRERIYGQVDGDYRMAGILIYTAAADSDGTLGGLVELGKPENLGRLIQQALSRAEICSSDPLCSEHGPEMDRSLHLSACHSCTFLSETSCERGNRYLDRALLVRTFESTDCAFFRSI